MIKTFDTWKKQFESEELEPFTYEKEGQLWLKIKSITRKDLLSDFAQRNSLELKETTLGKQFEELYNTLSKNIDESNKLLDSFMIEKNKEKMQQLDQKKLVSELYKLRSFEWGGDYHNSLDKYLVSHYVKAIQSYDILMSKFEHEISKAVQGYVLNSWYNQVNLLSANLLD